MAKNYSSDAYSKNRTGSEDEMRTAAERPERTAETVEIRKNSAKSTTSKNTHKDEMDRY